MNKNNKGVPESGKQYRLTGGPDTPSIARGDTWKESEVSDEFVERELENNRRYRLHNKLGEYAEISDSPDYRLVTSGHDGEVVDILQAKRIKI